MNETQRVCTLCSLPVRGERIVNEDGDHFCCTGCHTVYDTLVTRGISNNPDRSDRTALQDREGTSDIPDHHISTYLHIDGMHCSSCEVYIELIASDHQDVSNVNASYVSDTVRIDHDPDRVSEDDLIDVLSGLGYRAYRRDDVTARERAAERTTIRLGAGILFGLFTMFPYMMLIYPTYFDGYIYGEAVTELLIEGLYYGAASYLFIVIGFFTSVVLFYTGGPILRGAYVSLRAGAPNMDLLVSIAALSAYAYSWVEIYVGGTHIYFDVSVAIILVVTLGGEYETRIKQRAMEGLTNLTRIQIDEANRVEPDGSISVIRVDDVQPGDHLLVRDGERIPVDGTVVEGSVAVDESVITGESLPVTKQEHDMVVGGSIVCDGATIIAVNENASSSLDRITELVWNLQSSNRGIQKLADKLATIFVPLVLVLATLVTAYYLFFIDAYVPAALLVGLTVLIVSCPCALGLATPLAVSSGIRDAFARGIVVFDDTVFERLRDVDVVIFDKTGTLTTGNMAIIDADGPEKLRTMAGALERRSSHPIAVAIADAYAPSEQQAKRVDGGTIKDTDLSDPSPGATPPSFEIADFTRYQKGVGGRIDGADILVGHPQLFDDHAWDVSPTLLQKVESAREAGYVPVLLGRNGHAEGYIVVGDEPRPDWEQTLTEIANRGADVILLTGDEIEATAPFRDHPAVSDVFAGVPPEAKAETVSRYSATKQTVMVGDGTNDAPALASAHLGIVLGSGTAIAADAADVAIIDDSLNSVHEAFDLSVAAGKRVKQNIGWAFLYNGIAIPLAITGLLNPLFAAIAMATSSIIVVTNSTRTLDE